MPDFLNDWICFEIRMDGRGEQEEKLDFDNNDELEFFCDYILFHCREYVDGCLCDDDDCEEYYDDCEEEIFCTY